MSKQIAHVLSDIYKLSIKAGRPINLSSRLPPFYKQSMSILNDAMNEDYKLIQGRRLMQRVVNDAPTAKINQDKDLP